MIYEVRVYEPAEGRADRMRARFETQAAPLFTKHGIELLGVFAPAEADGRLIYMTRFENEEARKQAWAAFGGDEEWKRIKSETEQDGPLLAKQTVTVLNPTLSTLPLN